MTHLVYTLDENTLDAIYTYIKRKCLGISYGTGTYDNAGRWYPKDDERQECCDHMREPSRSYPYSLLKHCCTATHVGTRFHVAPEILKSPKVQLEAAPLLMMSHCTENNPMYKVFKNLLQTGRL